jgi:hypothetical protein
LAIEVAFRELYNQWMTTTKHKQTPSNKIKHAPLPTVCEWILAACCSISPEIVEKAFKVAGICNEVIFKMKVRVMTM